MAAVRNPTSLADVARATRPVALAREQVVPVLPALRDLLPDGALQRGSTVVVDGAGAATSVALALAAGPSIAGGWVAVVGRDDLGLSAAGEAGVALDRLALVADPPPGQWPAVVAALIGAVDVVVLGPTGRVRAADARRLAARARERGTVLVQTATGRAAATSRSPGLEVDLRLTVVEAEWRGVGAGHGCLRARRVGVEAVGRRRAARPRRVDLWLPDERGRIVPVVRPSTSPGAAPPVAPVRRVGAVGVEAVEVADRSYAGADVDRLVDLEREVG